MKKAESANGKLSAKEQGDNSSDTSETSMESEVETCKNNSSMNDHFNWNRKPDLGITKNLKSFAVICEGESESNEKREFNETPTSRWIELLTENWAGKQN